MPGKPSKTCTSCGKTKPLGGFYRNSRGRPGHISHCKECDNARSRTRYRANREQEIAKALARYQSNRDQALVTKRKWYEQNRERQIARSRARYAANRDQERAKRRAAYQANREERIAKQTAWNRANPEKLRAKEARRRAQKMALPNEDVDFEFVLYRDAGICGICEYPVDPEDWHLDHVVPLSKGGHHTYENVQVAHPDCNQRKHARLPT